MASIEQVEKNIVASFDLVKRDIIKLWDAFEKLEKEVKKYNEKKKR